MWLILTVLVVGLLQFLDTGLYTYIAYSLRVDGFYLGIVSAAWSVAYIISNSCFSRLADRGRNKVLLLIASVALILIYVLFSNISLLNGLMLYSLHAIAVATVNLSLSITILEMYDYTSWNSINTFSRMASNLVRGSAFLLIALYFIDLQLILILTTVFTHLSLMSLPRVGLNIERTLFKINRNLSYVGRYLKASTALLCIHKPREALEYFEKVWSGSNDLKPWRVLTSTALYTAFGDMVLVVLPLLLKDYVGLNILWLSWGVAFLLTPLIVLPLVSKLTSDSRDGDSKLIGVLIFLRGLALTLLLLTYLYDGLALTLYLLLIVMLSSMTDSLTYNKFVGVSAGYGVSNYYIAREVGSITGSLIGGLVFMFMPWALPTLTIVLAIASVVIITL